jgi:hypothetical protein
MNNLSPINTFVTGEYTRNRKHVHIAPGCWCWIDIAEPSLTAITRDLGWEIVRGNLEYEIQN